MDNEQQQKYWFFGSKLNTALLLVLIVLMVGAICIMLQNKGTYLPIFTNESNKEDQKNIDSTIDKTISASLTEKDNKGTVSIVSGNSISITLANPGDGGYQFEDPVYDKTILVLKKLTHTDPEPAINGQPIVGNFGTDTWTFTAIKTGTTKISINASQPWDATSKTTIFSTSVVVK